MLKYTRRNCTLFVWCAVFSMLLLLCGCNGTGDWTYDGLPKNYEIWRINSNDISLCRRSAPDEPIADVIIDSYIDKIAFNEQYVAAQQVRPTDRVAPDIKTEDLEISYYLLDTDVEELFGPFDESAFLEKCAELDIADFPSWIETETLSNK